VDESDTAEIHQTRRLRCAALIAVAALVIMALVVIGVYVIACVILSPAIG
jgi:hypothetical protein